MIADIHHINVAGIIATYSIRHTCARVMSVTAIARAALVTITAVVVYHVAAAFYLENNVVEVVVYEEIAVMVEIKS